MNEFWFQIVCPSKANSGRDGWDNQLSGAHRHVGEVRPQPLHLQRVLAEGSEDHGHRQPRRAGAVLPIMFQYLTVSGVQCLYDGSVNTCNLWRVVSECHWPNWICKVEQISAKYLQICANCGATHCRYEAAAVAYSNTGNNSAEYKNTSYIGPGGLRALYSKR